MDGENQSQSWWGEYHVGVGEVGRWRLGSLELWVEHSPKEWRISTLSSGDPLDRTVDVACPAGPTEIPPGVSKVRIVSPEPFSRVLLCPALADRPVVARPELPVTIPPAGRIDLFVGLPVWVQLRSREDAPVLFEVPIYRPSDTWFGPDTKTGRLGYASRTEARSVLDSAYVSPVRAVSRLTVRNHGNDSLRLERIALPVENLDIQLGEDGRLWTSPITVERPSGGGDDVQVEIGHVAPGAPPPLARARKPEQAGVLTRALSALLG